MTSKFPEIDQALRRLRFYQLAEVTQPLIKIELDRLQMQVGWTLSADYRYFLTTYGPGSFETGGLVTLPDGSPLGECFSVDILFGISDREDWNPFSLLQVTYRGVLPDGYLPIATDPGGNLLLLHCGVGTIFAWDHEHRELNHEALALIVHELEAGGLKINQYDLGQLILMWENLHPERIENSTGHGNLYFVSDSFSQLLECLNPDPHYH